MYSYASIGNEVLTTFVFAKQSRTSSIISKMTRGRTTAVICILSLFCVGISDSSTRTKRELRFPKGSSLVVAVAAVTFLPKGPTDGFAHFVEFDLGFPFPDSFAIDKAEAQKKISWKPTYKKVMRKSGWKKNGKLEERRGKRNLKDEERENLMWKLEDAINRLGFNGSSCMSRFKCELRHISPENSLLEKLLTALFKTSNFTDENCEKFISNCPISLLHVIMHSQRMESSDVSL